MSAEVRAFPRSDDDLVLPDDACHLCLGVGACPECEGDGERKPGPSVNEVRRQSKRRTLTRLRDSLAAALEEVDIELEGL